MALVVGVLLATAFVPLLLSYLLFPGVVVPESWVCHIGFFIKTGIIAKATVFLLASLIIPACVASDLSLFAYTISYPFTDQTTNSFSSK